MKKQQVLGLVFWLCLLSCSAEDAATNALKQNDTATSTDSSTNTATDTTHVIPTDSIPTVKQAFADQGVDAQYISILLLGETMPECTDTNKGLALFSEEENKFYFCKDSTWTEIDLRGEKGDKGDPGAQGIQGDQGEQGTQGEKGGQGDTGVAGATGAAGAKGDKGDKGDTGSTGAAGQNGSNGANGTNGSNGTNGTNGTNGSTGVAGAKICTATRAATVGTGNECPSSPAGTVVTFYNETVTLDANNNLVSRSCDINGSVGQSTKQEVKVCQGVDGATGAQGTAAVTTFEGIEYPYGSWGAYPNWGACRQVATTNFYNGPLYAKEMLDTDGFFYIIVYTGYNCASGGYAAFNTKGAQVVVKTVNGKTVEAFYTDDAGTGRPWILVKTYN